MRSRDRLIIQTSQRIQMAKTRKLTATFADGTQTTRVTARTYTHVVEVITKFQLTNFNGVTTNHTRTEQKWCGRPDLMQKVLNKFQGQKGVTTQVGEVTNDSWAN